MAPPTSTHDPVPATPVDVGDRTQTIQSREKTPPRDVPEGTPSRAERAPAESLPIDDPDRYSLVGEHARGGLGRVVRAVDRRLGRTVAVKELLKKSDSAEALFVREALITARLQHPGIVPVIEAGRWPSGEPYYVMKLVEGRSLKELIGEHKTLEGRLGLLPSVIAVAEAIGYAHSQQVIHRDVKPANVVVGEFGETVVVDWGLARDGRHTPASDVCDELLPISGTETVSGRVIGTPQYMAPEQARGEPVDARADVYALGALLYEVLAGVAPYAGRDASSILDAVVTGPPRSLGEAAPGVAPDLLAITAKAMARWPDDRYPTGKELAEDLKRFQTGKLVTAQQYGTVQLARRWIAHHRGPVAVAGVAAVLMVAIGIGMVARIVEERNLARRESDNASAMRRKAEARAFELRELQAASSVRRDPTAAVAWLKQLDLETCTDEASSILEESLASGVARHVFREDDWVYAVAFTPDGKTLSTASKDGKVRLYDLGAAAPTVRVLGEHAGGVSMTSFTRDGATLVTAGEDGKVRMWPVAGGPGTDLGALSGPPKEMRMSDDGALEVRSEDGELSVWNMPSGELVGHIQNDPRLTGAMAGDVSPTDPGRWLVGYQDGSLRLIDRTGTVDLAKAPHAPRVISFSPDGEHAAIYDGATVYSLDLASRRLAPIGAIAGPVTFLRWAPDGSTIAVGGDLIDLHLLPAAGGKPRILRGHTDSIYVAHWTRDGRRILTASDDTTARVWDLVTGGVEVLRGHDDDVVMATFSPDETSVATASLDGSARVWHVGTSGVRVLGGDLDTIVSTRLIDDHTALTVSSPLQVVRWDLRTGDRTVLVPRADDVYKVMWPASSRHGDLAIVPGGSDDVLLIRADGRHVTLRGHTATISGGGFAADDTLFTSSWDGTVRRWNADTGEPTTVLSGANIDRMVMAPSGDRFLIERAGVMLVTLLDGTMVREIRRSALPGTGAVKVREMAPDGESVVFQSRDGSLVHWQLDTGAMIGLTDVGHTASSVAFSPDGRWLAGAMADRTVRVWDLASGELRHTLNGHIDLVIAVAFSPDGRQLASTSYDRTVRVWNLATEQSRVLRGHSGAIETIAWLDDGARLITAGRDGTMRIWPTPPTGTPSPKEMRIVIENATTAVVGANDKLATPVL